ncbi:MAG: mechanosensitive ion channel, partial [Gemmatimonadetes bacterium]|nr:mechanosensitive ion channel [Gemmatimonadota bacterium]
VASYTNFPHLRIDVPVTVSVEEDLGRVRSLMLGIVHGNPEFMTDPAPEVVVNELNDYNVAMSLRAWIHDERNHIARRLQLREQVFETLRSGGVDMPYETIKNLAFFPEGVRTAS